MHRAQFTIPCRDGEEALNLSNAVRVEADEGPEGTSAVISVSGHAIEIAIEGADLSGLRAAVHGLLRLLDTAKRVSE